MGKRRTNPYYLSNEEAARERRRTEVVVKSIVSANNSGSSEARKQTASCVRSKGTTKVGETDNFIVDFDDEEKLVMIYGKELQTECRFRLAFDRDELAKIVDLLKKAYGFF